MKFPYLLAGLAAATLCFSCEKSSDGESSTPEAGTPVTAQVDAPAQLPNLELPVGTVFVSADSLEGDFNQDGIRDRVEVIEAATEGDFGKERSLVLYSEQNGERRNWYVAPAALLASAEGGVMGDPFVSLQVVSDTLLDVRHAGGSRIRWSYWHQWAWDGDDFSLVELMTDVGEPCVESESLTLNYGTSEGDFVGYGVTADDCEGNETGDWALVNVPVPSRPRMKAYDIGANEVKLPFDDKTMYY